MTETKSQEFKHTGEWQDAGVSSQTQEPIEATDLGKVRFIKTDDRSSFRNLLVMTCEKLVKIGNSTYY